ncbi:MAG: glycine cleavage system protein GcvH [Candidatus Neomarinimicrobiota bacterium]|nr:glycine cleavage system protein GcvH [Candidatus Neomarinimicrobiota bacterium]
MNIPDNLLYTKDHEWVKITDDIATIGITDYAQSELGDIIFIEFPELNDTFQNEDILGTIEAVKTVADLFSPISGKVIEVNSKLENEPELTNNDPYENGWIIKMKIDNKDSSNLLTSKEYEKLI